MNAPALDAPSLTSLPCADSESLHARVVARLAEHAQCQRDICHLLAEIRSKEAYTTRAPTYMEYAVQWLHLSSRMARDYALAGQRLKQLPTLDRAFAKGELNWSKVRALVRVVTPETESTWLNHALECTVREVEDAVALSVPGDDPPTPESTKTLSVDQVWFRVRMTRGQYQALRQGMARLRGACGDAGDGSLDDADLLLGLVVGATEDLCGSKASSEAAVPAVIDEPPEPSGRSGEKLQVHEPGLSPQCEAEAPKCAVPNCRISRRLELHSLTACDGQPGREDRCIWLCGAHHRAVHRGAIRVSIASGGRLCFGRAGASEEERPFYVALARLLTSGPRTLSELVEKLAVKAVDVQRVLERLESEGTVVMLKGRRWVHIIGTSRPFGGGGAQQ